MHHSPETLAYIERTEREKRERYAKAHAEGCPPGWEEEWAVSGKFRMRCAEKGR